MPTKNRKAINDECADLERGLKDKQAQELAQLRGEPAEDGSQVLQDDDDAALNRETDGRANGAATTDGIAAELEKATLSEDPAPQQTQGPGKKRNRQKERLARRAAEQAAGRVLVAGVAAGEDLSVAALLGSLARAEVSGGDGGRSGDDGEEGLSVHFGAKILEAG